MKRRSRAKQLLDGLSLWHGAAAILGGTLIAGILGVLWIQGWLNDSYASTSDHNKTIAELAIVKEETKVAANTAKYGLLILYDQITENIGRKRERLRNTKNPAERQELEKDIQYLENEKVRVQKNISGQK